MAFFDCHRKIVFREAEGNLWSHVGDQHDSWKSLGINMILGNLWSYVGDQHDSWTPELSAYAVPMASPDEILIEKTPHIISRGYQKLKLRAELMKKTMGDIKILVMLCDPINRFISLEKHHTSAKLSPTARDELTGIELTFSKSKVFLPSFLESCMII